MSNVMTMPVAARGRGRTSLLTRLIAPALALVLALLVLAPATAHAQIDPLRLHSTSIGVTDGQYLRLNAYFVTAEGARADLPPGPCRVTLRFLDARGVRIAESIVTLAPGRAALLDYRPAGLRAGQRATVRAVLLGEPDANGLVPHLVPSLEVIDVATGRTSIVSPGTIRGFNPQPEPPGDLGLFGAASGQVAHLTATYVGLPSDTGLPPGPCNVLLTVLSGDGVAVASRQVTLAPGETVALDFAAGALPPGIRRRMSARVTTDGREQGFVTSAVEIVDEATGKSAALLPGNFVQSWGWE